jgi:hypothetical protein
MKQMRNEGKFDQPMLSQTLEELSGAWNLGDADDRTIMRVTVDGWNGTTPMFLSWLLKDQKAGGIHSMARTTGSTAALVARLILEEKLTTPGVIAPEQIGANDQWMDFIMEGMADRNIKYLYSCGGADRLQGQVPPRKPTTVRSLSTLSQGERDSPAFVPLRGATDGQAG